MRIRDFTYSCVILAVFLAVQSNASIFLVYLQQFLDAPTDGTKFLQLMAIQLVGLPLPLLAGPCRIAAYSLTTLTQTVGSQTFGSGILMGYLYVGYSIKSADDLMVYLMDYIVYGVVYDMLGWETTFTEINFFPSDLMCYYYNFYGTVSGNVPLKVTGGDYEKNTMFYGLNSEASYPTQAEVTTCRSTYSGNTAVCN